MDETGEFRRNWRPLAGAFLGIGSALSLNTYILSTFAPYFIAEFGWTKEQWTWLSVVQMMVIFSIPVSGRLADRFGVWRTAAVGALSYPLFLVAIAFMDGSLMTYFWIYVIQTIVCSTTTSTVYNRVVAQAFVRNRGLAMGLAGSGAPLIGAIGAPLISLYVQNYGFSAGYVLVAAFCMACAVGTLWLLKGVKDEPTKASARADYGAVLSDRAFWIMLAATFLVNVPFSLATTQIKLVSGEQGLPDTAAALMVTAIGLASVAGRFIFGIAIDRLNPPRVAAFGFALPVLGLLLLASPLDSFAVVLFAMVLIGFAFGSEADVVPVLVARHFGIARFGTVVGLLTAAMGAAMAGGSILIALVQRATGSFNGYLFVAAAMTAVGSLLFLMLGGRRFTPVPTAHS
ncbi:nitrate/nitrite transporter [Novosphingobium sp. TH158]|uniref:MFS transporter n=1 Tax=Novosphingobium sp. TH158 TaxID=2067455 RepID=UPI00130464C8|nr:MFS transporter [Novosphingobium sp. TH158]